MNYVITVLLLSLTSISSFCSETKILKENDTPDITTKQDNLDDAETRKITINIIGSGNGSLSGGSPSTPMAGDVTGSQGATVINSVGGQSASDIAAAVILVHNATSLNIPNTIVKRDGSGNFAASTITANITGNVSGSSASFTDALAGDVTGNQTATVVSFVGGQSAIDVATATIAANNATNNDIANTIVKRDGSGNFSATTITSNLVGNVTGNASGSAASFTDALLGDVTGHQTATIVSFVGGQSAIDVATGVIAANNATSTNIPNTIVIRDNSGNFIAGTITANVTGASSSNVLKTGDTMTGSLQLPIGSVSSPSLTFTGNTSVGLCANNGSLSFCTTGTDRLRISSSGIVTIGALNTTGILHNDSLGNISTSLITDADISPSATISDTKLATITTSGKISNSATTATSLNIGNTIISRDSSGNCSAGTITTNVTGAASLNILKTGDCMTGILQLPVGSVSSPSLTFTGNTSVGLCANNGNLSFCTTGTDRLRISPSGTVTINALNTTGILHNNSSGTLSTSLITDADISVSASIGDTKLATITTSGKISNSATTATSLNSSNAIVTRDSSGNFAAGTVTASVAGAASLNVLKTGDTMSGILTCTAGTIANPSIQFAGSTNTGICAATANTLSFDANGVEQLTISTAGITAKNALILTSALINKAIQSVVPTNAGSVSVGAGISILVLKPAGLILSFSITFPPNPTDGQLFTILLGTSNVINLSNIGGLGSAAIINPITLLNPILAPTAVANGRSVTYIYAADTNSWYAL